MIVIYTGRPGAGKTYRVVWDLYHKYSSEQNPTWLIYHNLEGLKEDLFPQGGAYLKDWRSIPNFLSYQCQRDLSAWADKVHPGKRIVIVVDEAQSSGFRRASPDILDWLTQHRHLNQDILLVTQHYKNLDPAITNIAEYEIRAKKGITLNQFVYTYQIQGEKWKTDRVKTSKLIYGLYRSVDFGSATRDARPWWIWAIPVLLLCSVSGFAWLVSTGLGLADRSVRGEQGKVEPRAVVAPARKSENNGGGAVTAVQLLKRFSLPI